MDHAPILYNHHTMTSGPRSDTLQPSHDDEWTTLRYFTIITRWRVDHAPILYNHHTMVSGEYRSMINRGSTVLLLNGLHRKYIVKQKLNKKLGQWFSNQYIFLAQDYLYIINDESSCFDMSSSTHDRTFLLYFKVEPSVGLIFSIECMTLWENHIITKIEVKVNSTFSKIVA